MEVIITSRCNSGDAPAPARTPSPKRSQPDFFPPIASPLRCLPAPLPFRNPDSSPTPPGTHSPTPLHLVPSVSPRLQPPPTHSHSDPSPYRFPHRFSPYPLSFPSPAPRPYFPPPRPFQRQRHRPEDLEMGSNRNVPCKPSPPLLIPTSLTPFRLPAAFTNKKKILSFSSGPVPVGVLVGVGVQGPPTAHTYRVSVPDLSGATRTRTKTGRGGGDRNRNGNGNGAEESGFFRETQKLKKKVRRRRRRSSRHSQCPFPIPTSEQLRGGKGGGKGGKAAGKKYVLAVPSAAVSVSPSTSRFCRIGGGVLGGEVEKVNKTETVSEKLKFQSTVDQTGLEEEEEEEEVLSVREKLHEAETPEKNATENENEPDDLTNSEGEGEVIVSPTKTTVMLRVVVSCEDGTRHEVPGQFEEVGEPEEEGEVEPTKRSPPCGPGVDTGLHRGHSVVNLQVPLSPNCGSGGVSEGDRSWFGARPSPTRRTPKEVIQLREDQIGMVQVKKKSQRRLLARIMNEEDGDERQRQRRPRLGPRAPPRSRRQPSVRVVGEVLFGGGIYPKKRLKRFKKKKGAVSLDTPSTFPPPVRDHSRLVESRKKAKWIAGGGWRMPRRGSRQNKTPGLSRPKEEISFPRISSKDVLCGEGGIPQSTAVPGSEGERRGTQIRPVPLNVARRSRSQRQYSPPAQVDAIQGVLRKGRQTAQVLRQLQICPSLVVRKAHPVETINLFPSKKVFRAPPVRVKKKRRKRRSIEEKPKEEPVIPQLKPPVPTQKRRSPRLRTDSPVTGWQVPEDETNADEESETKTMLKVPARILVRDKSVEFSQAVHQALRERLHDDSADLLSLALVPKEKYYESFAKEIRTILKEEEDILIPSSPRH